MKRGTVSEVCIDDKGRPKSLETILLEYAYELLLTSRKYKRTKTGYLMHRSDARSILANKIKINRIFFDAIISELGRQGIVKVSNQGIYLVETYLKTKSNNSLLPP